MVLTPARLQSFSQRGTRFCQHYIAAKSTACSIVGIISGLDSKSPEIRHATQKFYKRKEKGKDANYVELAKLKFFNMSRFLARQPKLRDVYNIGI